MNPIDAIVGKNVRDKRVLRGMSQEQLAQTVGVTFQQLQKYERGDNRISASRLVELAKSLSVPVAELFDGVAEEKKEIETRNLAEMRRQHKVVEQYALLPDDVQKSLAVLVNAISISLGQKFTEGKL